MAQVAVTTKLPAAAPPGGSFIVELNIAKGDVSGFAKLQQQLPPGFSAEVGESANATFSFKDQKVKFLWMALPNDNFKVTYKVNVDPSLSGNQIIEGTFAYIKDNETEKFVIAKDIITIRENQADAAKQAAMDKILADQKAKEVAADAARKEAAPEEEVVAEVAEPVKAEPVKAEPVKAEPVKAEPVKAEPVKTEPVKAEPVKAEPVKEEVAEEVSEEVVDNSAELAAAEAARKAEEARKAKEAKDAEAARKKQEADAAKQQKADEAAASKAKQAAPASDYNDAMMKSKAGLVFRVQIAAGPNKVDPSFFQSKYGITDVIVIEEHEGLYKYVVGEFGSYRPAKTFSNELRDGNSVVGPFVTSYNDGKRIHVKEALDIAGQ
jgi:hypothetical protein